MKILAFLWERWKAFAKKLATVQSYILLGFFYYLILWPAGLIVKNFTDPLRIKKKGLRTAWIPWDHPEQTLPVAKRQY